LAATASVSTLIQSEGLFKSPWKNGFQVLFQFTQAQMLETLSSRKVTAMIFHPLIALFPTTRYRQYRTVQYHSLPFPLPPSNGQHATYITYNTLRNTIAHFPPLCNPSPRFKKWAIRTLSLNHTYAVARHIIRNAPVHGGPADHPLHLHTPAKHSPPILLHFMVFLLLLMCSTLAVSRGLNL
jgi:hypothetical protein